jgi:hypothetical protein
MCATHYENNSYCCQRRGSQSQARAAQSWEKQASPGIEPGPAWQGGGVSCCATKHNGLFGKVGPVANRVGFVYPPLRPRALRPSGLPNPRYVLRPLRPARVAHGSATAVAKRHTPSSHWLAAVTAGAVTAECSGQARCRAACGVGPRPQQGLALSRPGRAGLWPVRPPRGLPPPRRWGAVLLAGVVLVPACVGHGSLTHRRAPQPSVLARVQQRCQAVKAAARRLGAVACGQP